MAKDFVTTVNLTRPAPCENAGVFVDMLVDGNFKLILADPKNKHILLALLNEVMPVRINALTLVMQEQRGRSPELKSSVFDLMCDLADSQPEAFGSK